MVALELAASGSILSTVASVLHFASCCLLSTCAADDYLLLEQQRHHQEAVDFLFGGSYKKEPLELREKLGQGLFGEVFFTRRYGRVVVAKVPHYWGPVPPEPILRAEFQRACRLRHENLVKPFEKLGSASLWHFVEGTCWRSAMPNLVIGQRAQVAPQVASVMIYLTEASHGVWDLHSEDTILDIFGYPRQPGSFDLAGRFHAPGWERRVSIHHASRAPKRRL